MKALLILGGVRIGDMWHVVPIINRLKRDYDDITLVTGTYEKAVAEALTTIYNLKLEIHSDGFPQDIHSREWFYNQYKDKYDFKKFDYVFSDWKSTFEFEPNWKVELIETYLPEGFINKAKKEQIVVQVDSTSSCKRVDSLFHVQFPYPVVCVGGRDERRIPGSIDMMGRPWLEVLNTICESKLYVGIHSAATCAAFYTGVPMVVADYGKNFNFANYGHPNVIHLYDLPSTDRIQEAVNKLLEIK